MIDFLTIILLVFGVLQIILFFKIWRMTNNVNCIKQKLEIQPEAEDILIIGAQVKALNGDKEKAFELYQEAFYKNVIELFNKTINKYGDEDSVSYEERDRYYQTEYEKVVRYFNKRTDKLGMQLNVAKFDSYKKVHSLICRS